MRTCLIKSLLETKVFLVTLEWNTSQTVLRVGDLLSQFQDDKISLHHDLFQGQNHNSSFQFIKDSKSIKELTTISKLKSFFFFCTE